MKYSIKDISLANQGKNQVAWARAHMPALLSLQSDFKKSQPFKNLKIGMALHVTKETGVLVETLVAGGAQVAIASCNPLSTQDETAAYLAKNGIAVFAYKGESKSDYYKFIKLVAAEKPHMTIDDGCDLVYEIHKNHPQIIGGCEETTTGIIRLKSMEREGALKYPMVAVNDNSTKHLFDNFYGTGQSTFDGILRATNILIAGKTIVVAGYGDCGRGIALRAKGLGANVIVTEINPVRALQAAMDGYRVMKMIDAASCGDVFITATGDKHVITATHIKKMKSGAILTNSGHFNIEIDIEGLEKISSAKKTIRPFVEEYSIGDKKSDAKVIYLLAQGRLVNLSAAEGHPSEVMDLSFCGQALACEWLVKNHKKLQAKVYTLPQEIDEKIARLKLSTLEIQIDTLTPEQERYLSSWQEGT